MLQEKSWKDKKSSELNPKDLFQKTPILVEDQEETPDIDKWEKARNLETLHKYFTALQQLVCKSKEDEIGRVLKTIHKDDISLSWFRSSKVRYYTETEVDSLLANKANSITYKNITGTTTLDSSYNNSIIRILTTCNITIPSGLTTGFNCVFDSIGTVTGILS